MHFKNIKDYGMSMSYIKQITKMSQDEIAKYFRHRHSICLVSFKERATAYLDLHNTLPQAKEYKQLIASL